MDDRKKILLVSNPNNIHIYNYITNVLLKENWHITVYNSAGDSSGIKESYLKVYKQNNIILIDGISLHKFGTYSFFKITYCKFKELGHFDYLHLHYISHYLCPIIFLLRKNYRKKILSFWGSDLYRANFIKRILYTAMLIESDKLTFITQEMCDYFAALNPLYRKLCKKAEILDFGNMFYEDIEHIQDQSNLAEMKRSLGLDPNKVCVIVGYCGRKEMQQLRTVREILKIKQIYLDRIQLLLPLYMATGDTVNELNDILKKSKTLYKLFPYFMEPNVIVRLRAVSDVFIHTQTSDALSSAMLEHLYAGSVVMNGKWLNYQTLKDNNIYYKNIDSFDSIPNLISSILENLEVEKSISKRNKELVSHISSWSVLKAKWLNLYD